MAKVSNQMSVAELERLLENRKTQLNRLTKERDKLQKDLQRVEEKISSLEGGRGMGRRVGGTVRPKNKKSLHEVVTEILGRSKKGFPLGKLHDKVLESGYKTNSNNFKNVLYQCLYNSDDIQHDNKTGNYYLKNRSS